MLSCARVAGVRGTSEHVPHGVSSRCATADRRLTAPPHSCPDHTYSAPCPCERTHARTHARTQCSRNGVVLTDSWQDTDKVKIAEKSQHIARGECGFSGPVVTHAQVARVSRATSLSIANAAATRQPAASPQAVTSCTCRGLKIHPTTSTASDPPPRTHDTPRRRRRTHLCRTIHT